MTSISFNIKRKKISLYIKVLDTQVFILINKIFINILKLLAQLLFKLIEIMFIWKAMKKIILSMLLLVIWTEKLMFGIAIFKHFSFNLLNKRMR